MRAWRTLAVATLTIGLALAGGCGAPVTYPRPGYVRNSGQFGFAFDGNISHASGTIHYDQLNRQGMTVGTGLEKQGNASSPLASVPIWSQLFFAALSAEGGVAVGVVDGVELAGRIGVQQGGLELRARILPERSALRAALAIGGNHRTWFGADGFGGRVGFDFDVNLDGAVFILDAYLGYGPKRRTLPMPVTDESRGSAWFIPNGSVQIDRDELILSIPLGIALGAERPASAMVIGLTPEFTLASPRGSAHCRNCSEHDVAFQSFEQSFAVFLTVGLHISTSRPDK